MSRYDQAHCRFFTGRREDQYRKKARREEREREEWQKAARKAEGENQQPHGVAEPTGLHFYKSSSHLSFLTAERRMHSVLSSISFFHLEGGNGRRETQRKKRDRQTETERNRDKGERDKGRDRQTDRKTDADRQTDRRFKSIT